VEKRLHLSSNAGAVKLQQEATSPVCQRFSLMRGENCHVGYRMEQFVYYLAWIGQDF